MSVDPLPPIVEGSFEEAKVAKLSQKRALAFTIRYQSDEVVSQCREAMSKQKLKQLTVFLGFLFTVTSAFSIPNIDGEWLNRSKDFSLVVWTMGSVVCGYLNETGGRDGRGNNSFFVGRLGEHSTEVAYDSPYAEGRGTASLSLVGGKLKWHVIKEIPGGYTRPEEQLERVRSSGFFNQDDLEHDRSQCSEWRPFIESGHIDDLELQEIGGYKHNLH